MDINGPPPSFQSRSHGDGGRPVDEMPLVLVLGLPDSVHIARWLNMVRGQGIRFVLLPVYRAPTVSELHHTRSIRGAADVSRMSDHEIGVFDLDTVPEEEVSSIRTQIRYAPWKPEWMGNLKLIHPAHVAVAIRRLRPTILHSTVVQFGGYLAHACRQYLQQEFPLWLLSNWGSDIFLYRKVPEHNARIQQIIPLLDGYHSECERDLQIARQMGFRRFAFPCLPASGGMDFSNFPPLDSFERPSSRREILVKGYQGWAGRASNVLAAIHLAADALRGYKIRVTLVGQAGVYDTVQTIAQIDGLDITVEPYLKNHEEALLRLAKARIVVGMGISDGVSTTLLEAMAVGAFPIQGCNSCGNEWIETGKTGMLLSPHDVGRLAESLQHAVQDDLMVDAAAARNREVVVSRWDARVNGVIAISNYQQLIVSSSGARRMEQLHAAIATEHA